MDNKKIKDTAIYLAQLATMVIGTYLVFTFVVRPMRINGSSMKPTVYDGDFAVTNVLGLKLSGIERFDVVVIDSGGLTDGYIIKRVIGLPGETVKYQNDQLYINGQMVNESFLDQTYIAEVKITKNLDLFTHDFEYTVPENEYFVLGDNRPSSQDSRSFGAFKLKDIIGKGGMTIFPFNHFNFID
jgi:signal peptidase I, bacterial type